MEIELVVNHQNNCIINGLLTREYVSSIISEGDKFITHSDAPVFDFNNLETCDSSSVALMIHWWRLADSQAKTIKFINLSAKLLAIIRLSNVDSHLIS